MEDLTKEIASIFQNETFSFQNTKELLRLITQQNNNLFDLKFLGNSDFSLLLKARKNGGTQIAIKVVKYDANLAGIQTAKREYELLQDGIISDYFIKVYDQYQLYALSDKQRKTNEENLSQSKFFVQELELCSGNLKDLLTQFREKKENPSDTFKEILAIQMLDALNLLHSRGLIHRNIKPSNFLVSQNNNSENSPIILKLSDIGFVSPWKKSKLRKSSEHLVYLAPETQDQHCLIESDLFSLGMILLELDNAVTFDGSKVIPEELQQLKQGKIFENKNINRSSFLYEIAKTFLKPSPQNRESAHEMLWKLLNKSKEYQKIPIFSIFFKNQLKQKKPFSQVIEQISDDSKTHLTPELIESALEHMLEWEDFEGNFDLISYDSYGVVFGARNLKHNRNCVLKLSICLNKAEEMRKIMVRKMCLTPYFVDFYGYRFFQNTHKTHEFVVLELERCRYSLTNYLENQRIEGELLKAQKEHLAAQMIDAVNFLHQNQISQINLTLDSFLVTQEDNELGQIIVKLSRFSQGTMDNYLKIDEKAMINPLQEYLQTKQSDYFELGQCLLFLDNYPNLPDYLFTSKGSLISPQYYSKQYLPFSKSSSLSFINKSTSIYDLARQLHNYSIQSPNILNKPISNLKNICPIYSETLQYPFQEHLMHQQISFNIINISNNFHQNCLKSLSNFKNLKYLSLNLESKFIKQREAQSLLSSLENLSNLQTLSLNLKANQIGSEGASYLLSPLAHLTNLNSFSLDLSYNQIEIVGAQFLLLPISHLVNISKLSLNLQLNDIRAEGTDYLLQPLNNLINLQALSLNLQWNKINQDDLQYVLLSPLSNLHNLSILSLNLEHNEINAESARSLLSPIDNLFNLTELTLELGANRLSFFGTSPLFLPSFYNFLNLQNLSLNLSTYQIAGESDKNILSPLANLVNLSSLSLNLKVNQIREDKARHLLVPLQDLANLSSLSLDLSQNGIGSVDAKYLLSPLARSINLSVLELNLQSNDIELEGVKSILFNLAGLQNIQILSLNLENNQIIDIGEVSFLSPLSNFIKLNEFHLNLEWNKIGDIGAKNLLSPLTNLTNILRLSLNLGSNEIEVYGIQSLLDPLKNMYNLQTLSLDFNHNKITRLGSKYLIAPLITLPNISSLSLNLKFNQLQLDGAKQLVQQLSKFINLSSLSLDLSYNEIKEAKKPSILTKLTNFLFSQKSKQTTHILTKSSLLSPLANLTNLSTLSISLSNNQITDSIATSLLSPLLNHINLQNISLDLTLNEITSIGAQYLLSPLSNLQNISYLSLILCNNKIKDTGSNYLLSPLANLASLSTLELNIQLNQITDLGVQSILSSLTDIINLQNLSLKLSKNPTIKKNNAIIETLFRKLKKVSIS